MRYDEQSGEIVPATLGEYRKLCATLGGEGCRAVKMLDEKIADSPNGEDEEVIASDSQMRQLLMPMLLADMKGK